MASKYGKRIHSTSYAKYGYIFILPFFIVYIVFQIYPLINTFFLSTQSNGAVATTFVGIDNFKAILTGVGSLQWKAVRADFFRVMGNSFILWFGNFIPQIILSLVLAAAFTNTRMKIKGKGVYKILMYLPNIITAASSAALFLVLFSETQFGAINRMLVDGGLIDAPIRFVSGEDQSRGVIMAIQTWMWFGNTTIMLMAGIMGINVSLFEAASIDGASNTQQFFRITMPLLKPILMYTVITSMIGGLQMFDIPYLYNVGTTFNKFTETFAVFIYNHFHKPNPNYGYSAAASVLLFIITSILGSICFYINRDKDQKKLARKKTNNLF